MNEVKYYRKKPVVIQAYQTDKVMYIETLEGTHKANDGDYIITGVHGEQYPCKPDIFQKTYQQVTEKDYLALKDKPIYAEIICYSKEEYENTIKAIERQKVKEPILTHKICKIGKCQTCGQSVYLDDESLFYCPTCGQKLK